MKQSRRGAGDDHLREARKAELLCSCGEVGVVVVVLLVFTSLSFFLAGGECSAIWI